MQTWTMASSVNSGHKERTQQGLHEMIDDSRLCRMKKAYGIVSGSGIGPPMAARMPNKAPIFLVLPTLLSMI